MDKRQLGIDEKVKRAVSSGEYDAVVAFGPDHVQYLSGAPLPFSYSDRDRYVGVIWPKEGDPVVFCPAEWKTTVCTLSRIKKIFPYSEVAGDRAEEKIAGQLSDLLSEVIKRKGDVTVGIDLHRTPYRFFKSLQTALPHVRFVGSDDFLKKLRMIKTSGEAELLEEVTYRTEHGILGALHHVLATVSRYEKGLAEIIRMHCLERDLDEVGYHSISQAASGENAKKFWPLAPKFGVGWGKSLAPGEMVRLEMSASLEGYWSDATRMMIMGEPTPQQSQAYRNLVNLREVAMGTIKPGATCDQVSKAVKRAAGASGVELISTLSVGHGIGVTPHEPPYLMEGDTTVLEPGMVLVIDPVIYGPHREIMRSKDAVLITPQGCKVLGWYKDWREPYIATGGYPSGGG